MSQTLNAFFRSNCIPTVLFIFVKILFVGRYTFVSTYPILRSCVINIFTALTMYVRKAYTYN